MSFLSWSALLPDHPPTAGKLKYVHAGYWPSYPSDHGNVLLAFGP